MIQVKISKNVMNKPISGIPFSPIQIVFAIIGIAAGIATFFELRNSVNSDLLGLLNFLEVAVVICFGVVRPDGMNFIVFIASSFKIDKRPYNRKGVFNDD